MIMYIFESVIHASSFAFLKRFPFRLRNFSRSCRSFVTLAIFKQMFVALLELMPKFCWILYCVFKSMYRVAGRDYWRCSGQAALLKGKHHFRIQKWWHPEMVASRNDSIQKCWSPEMLASRNAGTQECWPPQMLASTNAGIQKCWPLEMLASRNAGIQKYWHPEMLASKVGVIHNLNARSGPWIKSIQIWQWQRSHWDAVAQSAS